MISSWSALLNRATCPPPRSSLEGDARCEGGRGGLGAGGEGGGRLWLQGTLKGPFFLGSLDQVLSRTSYTIWQ